MKKLRARVCDELLSFSNYTKFNAVIDAAKNNGLSVTIIKLRSRRKNEKD